MVKVGNTDREKTIAKRSFKLYITYLKNGIFLLVFLPQFLHTSFEQEAIAIDRYPFTEGGDTFRQ